MRVVTLCKICLVFPEKDWEKVGQVPNVVFVGKVWPDKGIAICSTTVPPTNISALPRFPSTHERYDYDSVPTLFVV